MESSNGTDDLRLAELVAALSLAGDLALGQPWEHGLRTCLLSLRTGQACGLDERQLRDLYYVALLRVAGCTADAHIAAALFGDEIAFAERCSTLDGGRPFEILTFFLRTVGDGEPPTRRARMVARALTSGLGALRGAVRSGCEVGQVIAERLGLGPEVRAALGQIYERWDGRGDPAGVKGEDLSPLARIAALAHDVETFRQIGGASAGLRVARERSGAAYDPDVVAALLTSGEAVLASLDGVSAWEEVLDSEPDPRPHLEGDRLESALEAIADFTDLKSPTTLGHSRGVARLAEGAAARLGLPREDQALARRAALVHDLGRVGVPASIWERRGALSASDWERVRLHPYLTERVLARPVALHRLAAVAGLHHERSDGSGYHRAVAAGTLPMTARVLAAADVYHAATEPRPHRPAKGDDDAAEELRAEVRAGRLDPDAAAAVLEAAGHPVRARRALPGGLSGREVEVLRLLARGLTNRAIAGALSVSAKTVDSHVQHVYSKLDVSTRAAAAMFAMQHGLVGGGLLSDRTER